MPSNYKSLKYYSTNLKCFIFWMRDCIFVCSWGDFNFLWRLINSLLFYSLLSIENELRLLLSRFTTFYWPVFNLLFEPLLCLLYLLIEFAFNFVIDDLLSVFSLDDVSGLIVYVSISGWFFYFVKSRYLYALALWKYLFSLLFDLLSGCLDVNAYFLAVYISSLGSVLTVFFLLLNRMIPNSASYASFSLLLALVRYRICLFGVLGILTECRLF